MHLFLIWFSALSFLFYGTACLGSEWMRREFARYGVAWARPWVGLAQIVGGLGLLAGTVFPWVGPWSASALALLMLGGIGIRVKIKDGFVQCLPAGLYLVLNAYLAFAGF